MSTNLNRLLIALYFSVFVSHGSSNSNYRLLPDFLPVIEPLKQCVRVVLSHREIEHVSEGNHEQGYHHVPTEAGSYPDKTPNVRLRIDVTIAHRCDSDDYQPQTVIVAVEMLTTFF